MPLQTGGGETEKMNGSLMRLTELKVRPEGMQRRTHLHKEDQREAAPMSLEGGAADTGSVSGWQNGSGSKVSVSWRLGASE